MNKYINHFYSSKQRRSGNGSMKFNVSAFLGKVMTKIAQLNFNVMCNKNEQMHNKITISVLYK